MAFYVVQRMSWLPKSFPDMIRMYKDLLYVRWLNSLSEEERREYIIAKQREEEQAREDFTQALCLLAALPPCGSLSDYYEGRKRGGWF